MKKLERSLFGFGNWVTTLGGLIVFMWDTQEISPQVMVSWRSSLHMRHDMESCDQGGENQDMTWLDRSVASVKGKSEALKRGTACDGEAWARLGADGPMQWWRASEVKIDEPIRSRDDMKWIISFGDWLVHVLHQHWRRWNEIRKAKV
jgi:hypothetical protein